MMQMSSSFMFMIYRSSMIMDFSVQLHKNLHQSTLREYLEHSTLCKAIKLSDIDIFSV